ncbi:MAG: 3-phosphoshikimate 1-carboxyvinyltransferase [Clostridium sp.]|nr:3-phosphoshikimate 1-carboxyvinyltransferase [Clostridium sp.]
MEQIYHVRPLKKKGMIRVCVPGSKSITNRALMLAALSNETCVLEGVLFSEDSRAFLACLHDLGFQLTIEENDRRVTICGTGGVIPKPQARIHVQSAGTAARFLTVMLAFAGGDYELCSSKQMAKRPMEPLLSVLEQGGAKICYHGERGHFPFTLHAQGMKLAEVTIDTSVSSQFASALLMAAALLPDGLTVHMAGNRTAGAYIRMTLAMMEQFGLVVRQQGEHSYYVPGGQRFGRTRYEVEPDVSGAAYFYSLAPLLGADVLVRGVHEQSLQGDIQYVMLLKKLGCMVEETADGLIVRGAGVTHYAGLRADMRDFSDQTMTMAALAVYADSATEIVGVGHIRGQETDRIAAILNELARMGIRCEEMTEDEGIRIYPGTPKPTLVETYHDHRMAMAFTLIGLRTDGIAVNDPECCKKTFENYFEVLEELYE